jgi:hypothetical protein
VGQDDSRDARPLAGGREFGQVRDFFVQMFPFPPAKPASVRLVAFGSMKEYEPYRFNQVAIAYYH